ncbi:hypothetical protein RHGRI_033294 [Rhododendron griersonianum]|uniref:Uncharacterized protein n=1 Tax=Rhododendron griersonianum TaxID=479676 RepID=A0AAV6HWA5_9ERIC|nr:hypothetical protein RHGRI_033294 [Rhododendron griersonianum]
MGENLNDWAIQVEDELMKLMATTETAEKQQCIYKVPEGVKDLNKKAYKPQFVSFGPYHHMEPDLEPMEKHKYRALLHVLKRSRKPLVSYIAALAGVAKSLKDSYESLDPRWDADTDRGFLMMMILDGCFMLEVLQTWKLRNSQHMDDYSVCTQQDEEFETDEESETVNKLICEFCIPNPWFPLDSSIGKCLHLLDVYRESLLTTERRKLLVLRKFRTRAEVIRAAHLFEAAGRNRPTGGNEVIRYAMELKGDNEVIRCAMELSDVGIRFKKSTSASLDDISFTGRVLSLPPIVVDDTTECMFLNLIAFERFHVDSAGSEVTSYIFFMSKIIESAEDVRLLRARGIIKNALGSDDVVAKLFDSLSKDITLDPDSRLGELQRRVNLYWRKRLGREELMQVQQNYFRNPWSIPAFIAAVFLFLFTLVQTAYTIISYHDPAKN